MEGLSHFGIVNGLTIFGELETLNKKQKISLKNVWQLFLFGGGNLFFVAFTNNLLKLVSEAKKTHLLKYVIY